MWPFKSVFQFTNSCFFSTVFCKNPEANICTISSSLGLKTSDLPTEIWEFISNFFRIGQHRAAVNSALLWEEAKKRLDEQAQGSQDAHGHKHPKEDSINHHGNVFPVILHLWAREGRREGNKHKTKCEKSEDSVSGDKKKTRVDKRWAQWFGISVGFPGCGSWLGVVRITQQGQKTGGKAEKTVISQQKIDIYFTQEEITMIITFKPRRQKKRQAFWQSWLSYIEFCISKAPSHPFGRFHPLH